MGQGCVAMQVLGATTTGSSLGVSVAPNGTSYTAWALLGTTTAPINYINFQATYPVGGAGMMADIGIGPSGSQIAIAQAIYFSNVNCPSISGPLYIPSNTEVWVRYVQSSSVSNSAIFSLTGWWKKGAPKVTTWYVAGIIYGTSYESTPTCSPGSGVFGTPVQYSTPTGNIKHLWILPTMGSNGSNTLIAVQVSIGPSGSQIPIYQQTFTGFQYSEVNWNHIEVDIPSGQPLWFAVAGASTNFGALVAF